MAIRLLDTLLLAAVTTKPAVRGMAGFVAGLDVEDGPQSDGPSVPRARLLVNVHAGQHLVRCRPVDLGGLLANAAPGPGA
jgi:hypothetical protein